MTVGELRMLLENIPDDYEVMVSRYGPNGDVFAPYLESPIEEVLIEDNQITILIKGGEL